MRILVACESSGIVRDAFRAHGHDAMSADLLPTEQPGPHYQGDVLDLAGENWDLVIAHPPCTNLANSGVRWLYSQPDRWQHLIEGGAFFRAMFGFNTPRLAVENPVQHKWAGMVHGQGAPTQIVQPWMFGHPETKATCLWLRGLPPLVATDNVRHLMDGMPAREAHRIHHLPPGPDRWRERSRTLTGLAEAMADQWGAAA
jgi:hypothetical protein